MTEVIMTGAEELSARRNGTYKHAERTASRSSGWDYIVKTWRTREAMAKAIRKQQQRASQASDWMAFVRLEDGEGY